MHGLYPNEPYALQQVNEQERARDELRAANRIGMENSAYHGRTECFTMSRTKMDSNPQPAPTLQQDPTPQAISPTPNFPAHIDARPATPLSPFAEIFVGPNGLYPGARWVIYLAMAFVFLGFFNSLLNGLRPQQAPLWWSMLSELRLMLAAVLPALVMARIEGRSFGDFGLPGKTRVQA